MKKSNIVLIGMPGAGKSTVGVLLAKMISFGFLDTDVLIQAKEGARLQDIIDTRGLKMFRKIEEEHICSVTCLKTVIATGGSAVYSGKGMKHLKKTGNAVYLQLPLEELFGRINNMDSRGVVISPGQTFEDLYRERVCLYEQFADITVHCSGLNHEQVAYGIIGAVSSRTAES